MSNITRRINLPPIPSFAESVKSAGLVEGQNAQGTIRRLQEGLGLFVRPDGCDYDILIHRGSLEPQSPINFEAAGYREGDRIRFRVNKIDLEKKQMNGAALAQSSTFNGLRPILSVGDRVAGIVDKVDVNELFIIATGGIRMRVPRAESGPVVDRNDTTTDLSEFFTTGQPVEAKILSIDLDRGHALASIRHALDDTEPFNRAERVSNAAPLTASLADIQSTRKQRKKQKTANA
jgi:ribosomal protein S1